MFWAPYGITVPLPVFSLVSSGEEFQMFTLSRNAPSGGLFRYISKSKCYCSVGGVNSVEKKTPREKEVRKPGRSV